MVYRSIYSCKASIDEAYGAQTEVAYNTHYLGQDRWLVDAYWPLADMSYGGWSVDSRFGRVTAYDAFAQTVLNLYQFCL